MRHPDDSTIASGADGHGTQADGDEAYCAACGRSYPVDVTSCPEDAARLTKLTAQPDPLLGRVFDERYEVRSALGRGGMGTVYRGWQLSVDREVAIKVIHPKLSDDRIAVKRFLREARLSSRLNQPNVVNVYDFGQTPDGILYIAMELLRGHTLARELESQRPLPLRRAVTIALQICDALDAAHAQGIVHRDLKPGNIVILDDPPGRDLVKVLDFGLAKSLVSDTSSIVTNTTAILGTPLYMPPEQIEGKPSDQRADIYSFGCILHHMLAGTPPFMRDSVNLILSAHLSDEPPQLPIGVPQAVVDVIRRMMAKDPRQRVASVAVTREVLQRVASGGALIGDESFTSPDVRLPVVAAFAETAAATSVPGSLSSKAAPASPASASLATPARPRSWRYALLAAALLVPLGALVYVLVRSGPSDNASVAPAIPVQASRPASSMRQRQSRSTRAPRSRPTPEHRSSTLP